MKVYRWKKIVIKKMINIIAIQLFMYILYIINLLINYLSQINVCLQIKYYHYKIQYIKSKGLFLLI